MIKNPKWLALLFVFFASYANAASDEMKENYIISTFAFGVGAVAANTCSQFSDHPVLCGVGIALVPLAAHEVIEVRNTHQDDANYAATELLAYSVGAIAGAWIGYDISVNHNIVVLHWKMDLLK